MESDSTTESTERDGWRLRELPGFIGLVGPLWTRREGDAWCYGLQMESKHLNPARHVHGGALLTLMDHAISSVAWEHCKRPPCVTVQLDSQFQSNVKEGAFVEVRVHITQEARSLCFARAEMHEGSRLVMTAQSILKKVQD